MPSELTDDPAEQGIDLDAVGIILMIVGVIGLVVSMLSRSSWGPYSRQRRETVVRDRDAP